MNTLQESSVLAHLTINQWRGQKISKELSEEIDTTHSVKKSGQFQKTLITSEELKPVRNAAEALRAHHRKNSLPWDDNGGRLLPSANYFDYLTAQTALRGDFDKAAKDFIDGYDDTLAKAKVRLNGLFRPSEYPSKTDLVDKFKVKSYMLAVPETDFRVALPDTDLAALKQQSEREILSRFQEAHQDNWNRVKETLLQMKAVFSSADRKVFSSLFEGLSEMITLLPKLNIAGDPNLDQVCQDLNVLLVAPEEVRKSDTLRAEKADQVDELLNKFNQFF